MKRFFITFAILFSCALLFFVGTFVILALAPGSEIFGVSYVSASVGEKTIAEEWNDEIDGDIFINTNEIPVTINFEPYGATKAQFVQKYSGYTTSKSRVPYADIMRDARGITVTTQEVTKFFIGAERGTGVTITLPESWVTTKRHSIYINGNSSNVTINASDDITINLIDLTVCGKARIKFNCRFDVQNLVVDTTQNLTLGDKIVAENVNYTSNAGSLVVKNAITGNLVAKTTSGSVSFVSCGNATITTSGGRVQGLDGAGCKINGTAKIKTKGGRVVIDELTGFSAGNEIVTNNGNITIGSMLQANITSRRGKIKIDNMVSGAINGGSGAITLGSVSGEVSVVSKRGDVSVGSMSKSQKVNKVNVSTTYGDIKLENTYGSVVASSKYSLIKLLNIGATANLSAGKTIFATGLKGETTLWAKGQITAAFSQMTGDATITGGKNCRSINVSIEENTINEFNIRATTTKQNGGIAKLYEGQNCTTAGVTLSSAKAPESAPNLMINATRCKINIYTRTTV